MARTTADAVRSVLLRDYDSANAPDLQPFIDTASVTVDEVEACAVRRGRGLSSGSLEIIERWLAAHYYSVSDRPYASTTTDRAGARFQGETGMYLESSHYGQTAKTLDASGCLSAMDGGSRKRAGATWLGRRPDDATAYEDRTG